MTRFLALILALFATAALAQTKGTPTLQIDKSGTTRCLYIYDIINPTNSLPLGCLNSGTQTWTPAGMNMADLSRLGAKLDNSPGDQTTIQTIYGSLSNGSVVQVPYTSSWVPSISPAANKSLTWIYGGQTVPSLGALPGDNDLHVSYNNSTMTLAKRLTTSQTFTNPVYAFLWNQNPNYNGPLQGNYQQYTPIYGRAISGPTSTGNTGALYGKIDGFGQGPSSSYDVNLFLETNKYGQNSTWGMVNQNYDFSGRPPQFAANWMEEGNIRANGYDVTPWDANYYNPAHAGGRVGFYLNFTSMVQNARANSTAVHTFDQSQGGATGASIIKVNVSGTDYTWYCVTSGTTAGSPPSFPAPVRFTGSISGSTLTVTAITAGTLATGQYVSGAGFITPLQITGQSSGSAGSTGVYTLSGSLGGSVTGGFFAAAQVTDGTAAWRFGTTFTQGISHAMFLTGDMQLSTVIGGDTNIMNAVVDTSKFVMDTNAAAIRLGTNHVIDFTSNGTTAGINQHTLRYTNFAGANKLAYNVASTTMWSVADTGSMYAQSMELPQNQVINFGSGSGSNRNLLYSTFTAGGALAYNTGGSTVFYIDNSGNTVISGKLTQPLFTPASSSATCTTGQQAADASFVYVCTATNTWKRAALSAF